MLIFCRLHRIGILLFLFHTTRSFVLLTANLDDVKRLASKFVSESLAEKIADFISKATEHMITNVSDEIVIDQVSEENNRYNIARERKETNQKAPDDLSIASYEAVEADIKRNKIVENTERIKTVNFKYIDSYKQNSPKYKRKPDNVKFVTVRERQDIPSHYIKANRDNGEKMTKTKVNDQPAKDYYELKSNAATNSKYAPKSKPKPGFPSKVVSTIGYAEDYRGEDVAVTKKLKSRINHSRVQKFATKKQLVVQEIDEPNGNSTDGSIPRAIKELTTKRVRSEFDQYDNLNYPKPDFIATSGPVALPKIPSNAKWTNNGEATKKFWF